VGPPSFYLGNDYTWSEADNTWVLGCATYIKECIHQLEDDSSFGILHPNKSPLPAGCHPELDASPLLDLDGIHNYQMLIGMAQWACTIGWLDIAFGVSSLSHFSAHPQIGHLELAVYLFGYLKKYPNRQIVLDSNPLIVDKKLHQKSFHPDILENYDGAKEEIGKGIPKSYTPPSWKLLYFLMLITHMTIRLGAPSQALLLLLVALQFYGLASIKGVLRHLLIQPSLS
jgi:hypothetical protein